MPMVVYQSHTFRGSFFVWADSAAFFASLYLPVHATCMRCDTAVVPGGNAIRARDGNDEEMCLCLPCICRKWHHMNSQDGQRKGMGRPFRCPRLTCSTQGTSFWARRGITSHSPWFCAPKNAWWVEAPRHIQLRSCSWAALNLLQRPKPCMVYADCRDPQWMMLKSYDIASVKWTYFSSQWLVLNEMQPQNRDGGNSM